MFCWKIPMRFSMFNRIMSWLNYNSSLAWKNAAIWDDSRYSADRGRGHDQIHPDSLPVVSMIIPFISFISHKSLGFWFPRHPGHGHVSPWTPRGPEIRFRPHHPPPRRCGAEHWWGVRAPRNVPPQKNGDLGWEHNNTIQSWKHASIYTHKTIYIYILYI